MATKLVFNITRKILKKQTSSGKGGARTEEINWICIGKGGVGMTLSLKSDVEPALNVGDACILEIDEQQSRLELPSAEPDKPDVSIIEVEKDDDEEDEADADDKSKD